MTPTVQFRYFDGPEQEAQIRAELTPLIRLLPPWCDSLVIDKYTKGPSESAAMSVEFKPEYRHVCVEVYPFFYERDAADRRELIIHEFVHAITGEMLNFVRDRVIPIIEKQNQELADFVSGEFVYRVEGMTQLLAATLNREIQ